MRPPTARRRWHAAAVGVALLLALSGCADDPEPPAAKSEPTPIGNLNTRAMQIPRIQFCPRIAPEAVAEALDAKADEEQSYGNGDEAPVLPGGATDVVQELGCEWRTEEGASARAWVFARPVTRDFATQVVRASAAQPSCRRTRGPAFGTPSYAQSCRGPEQSQRVRRAGLFGQTWLTCELTAPATTPPREIATRADAWCVEVANALNTAR